MADKSDNIELRSEKVRNIIGQIPPFLIRSGISVIFIVIIVLLVMSYFFKYSYTIETEIIFAKKNNVITNEVKIPANEIKRIKAGQSVVITFANISNMNNECIEGKLGTVKREITIKSDKAYYTANINIPNQLKTIQGSKILINNNIKAKAEIITEPISFFNRIISPIRNLFVE